MSPSGNAPALAEEHRVRFWSRPALDSPSLQQRVWHAWGAVQSPTGIPPKSPWPILQQNFANKLLFTDGMHAGSQCMMLCFQSILGAYHIQICVAALNSSARWDNFQKKRAVCCCMIVGLNLFPLNGIIAQCPSSIALQTSSGPASDNTLQYTLPPDLYPDPTLTDCMACAVQTGMCCANWHSTCLPTSIKSTI